MTLQITPTPLLDLEKLLSSNALSIELQNFTALLSERERAIFERRLLPNSPDLSTLQELADQFGITREAIRLAELKLITRLRELKQQSFSYGLEVANQFRIAIGSIAPNSYLPKTLLAKLQLPTGQLVCFLAGGYMITNDGLISKQLKTTSLRNLLKSAILDSETSEAGIEESHILKENLISSGMAPWIAANLVNDSAYVGHFESKNFVLPEGLKRRFKLYLRLTNSPASLEDAVAFLSEYGQVNDRSLKNAIGSDSEVLRVGANSFGLAEWGFSEFKNLHESMKSFLLKNGPTAIAELCEQLHVKYGAKKISISMYAQMHPKFVLENGVVRVRQLDEPVVYGLNIEQENFCFRSGDRWTWRVVVDGEVRRGSGISIPRGLAAYLELLPDIPKDFTHLLGTCNFNWTGINPGISSLKSISEYFNCSREDYLFLSIDKAENSIDIEMRPGYSHELGAEENLRNYFCASDSESAEESARRALNLNLNGVALWDALSMRAENFNDRILQLITKQLSN